MKSPRIFAAYLLLAFITVLTWTFRADATYTVSAVQTYTPTLANATASGDTTIVSVVIPANTWADGEVVAVRVFALAKNNSTLARTTLLKFNATGGVAAQIGSVSWADNANERKRGAILQFFRNGTQIICPLQGADNAPAGTSARGLADDPAELILSTASEGFNTFGWAAVTPTNFTSAVTLSLIVNLAVTDATYYFTTLGAYVYKSGPRFQ